MANILCIETSTEVCSVALIKHDHSVAETQLPEGNKHSAGLAQLIKELLSEQKIKIKELNAVAISDGPGSYTGLRVGCSTAKGICFAYDLPLIAIPTLQALANGLVRSNKASVASDQLTIMPTIDARRMEVYTALYDKDLNELAPAHHLIYTQESIDQLVSDHEHIIICGNGGHKLLASDINHSAININASSCNARDMASLALAKYDSGDFVNVAYHSPFYYKSPNITMPKPKL